MLVGGPYIYIWAQKVLEEITAEQEEGFQFLYVMINPMAMQCMLIAGMVDNFRETEETCSWETEQIVTLAGIEPESDSIDLRSDTAEMSYSSSHPQQSSECYNYK